jgi:hypothetical protein
MEDEDGASLFANRVQRLGHQKVPADDKRQIGVGRGLEKSAIPRSGAQASQSKACLRGAVDDAASQPEI